ncbi:MAG TPA: nickel pincer cofactor biosynthesis protein LarB, partial [Polyangiaceae bacterium]|nr:nickel pincer cofactor biosynthesis protein LarB [Polyangiaceae bacterium]
MAEDWIRRRWLQRGQLRARRRPRAFTWSALPNYTEPMDPERLRALLQALRAGSVDVDTALQQLRRLPFDDLGFANVDHHRALRQGVPEVILGQSKTAAQIAGVARSLVTAGSAVYVTRLGTEKVPELLQQVPELVHDEASSTASYLPNPPRALASEPALVVTAGTSDLPVAAEALETLRVFGVPARGIYDVGVAGLHRIVRHLDALERAPGIIVCAGMEGALASVVGGLVAAPVVAVPTSVGYGASLGGLAALL